MKEKKKFMIDFVNLMEPLPLRMDINHPKMDMYWQSEQWILEPVENGRRFQCLITDKIRFSTKHENRVFENLPQKIPNILEDIQSLNLQNTLFDGYLTSELQKEKQLQYVLTDVIFFNDNIIYDFPLWDRKEKLKTINQTKNLKISNYYNNSKYEIYQELRCNYDMFFFKDLDSPYIFGKSSRWKSLKEPQKYNCVLMKINEGSGKYKNMCGSITVGQYKSNKLIEITNVSGISYDDRVKFFNEPEKFINKVVEIKALKKTKDNFREASFSQLREDLQPEQCVWKA